MRHKLSKLLILVIVLSLFLVSTTTMVLAEDDTVTSKTGAVNQWQNPGRFPGGGFKVSVDPFPSCSDVGDRQSYSILDASAGNDLIYLFQSTIQGFLDNYHRLSDKNLGCWPSSHVYLVDDNDVGIALGGYMVVTNDNAILRFNTQVGSDKHDGDGYLVSAIWNVNDFWDKKNDVAKGDRPYRYFSKKWNYDPSGSNSGGQFGSINQDNLVLNKGIYYFNHIVLLDGHDGGRDSINEEYFAVNTGNRQFTTQTSLQGTEQIESTPNIFIYPDQLTETDFFNKLNSKTDFDTSQTFCEYAGLDYYPGEAPTSKRCCGDDSSDDGYVYIDGSVCTKDAGGFSIEGFADKDPDYSYCVEHYGGVINPNLEESNRDYQSNGLRDGCCGDDSADIGAISSDGRFLCKENVDLDGNPLDDKIKFQLLDVSDAGGSYKIQPVDVPPTANVNYDDFLSNTEEWFVCAPSSASVPAQSKRINYGNSLPAASIVSLNTCEGALNSFVEELGKELDYSEQDRQGLQFSKDNPNDRDDGFYCVGDIQVGSEGLIGGAGQSACYNDGVCFVRRQGTNSLLTLSEAVTQIGEQQWEKVVCSGYPDSDCPEVTLNNNGLGDGFSGGSSGSSSGATSGSIGEYDCDHNFQDCLNDPEFELQRCEGQTDSGLYRVECTEEGTYCRSGQVVAYAGDGLCCVDEINNVELACATDVDLNTELKCEDGAGNDWFEADNGNINDFTCLGDVASDYCCVGSDWQPKYTQNLANTILENERFVCYEQVNQGRFAECCSDASCFNGVHLGQPSPFTNIAQQTAHVFYGQGGVLHTVRNFDHFDNGVLKNYHWEQIVRPGQVVSIGIDTGSIYANTNWNSFDTLHFEFLSNLENPISKLILVTSSGSTCEIANTGSRQFLDNNDKSYVWHKAEVNLNHCPTAFNFNSIRRIQLQVKEPLPQAATSTVIVVDNFYLSSDETTQNSENLFCSGPFKEWVEDLDPPASIDTSNFVEYGPYQYACNAWHSYEWSGTQCCGNDDGESYEDSQAGCFQGSIVRDGWLVGSNSLNDPEYDNILFYKDDNGAHFYACETADNVNGIISIPDDRIIDLTDNVGIYECVQNEENNPVWIRSQRLECEIFGNDFLEASEHLSLDQYNELDQFDNVNLCCGDHSSDQNFINGDQICNFNTESGNPEWNLTFLDQDFAEDGIDESSYCGRIDGNSIPSPFDENAHTGCCGFMPTDFGQAATHLSEDGDVSYTCSRDGGEWVWLPTVAEDGQTSYCQVMGGDSNVNLENNPYLSDLGHVMNYESNSGFDACCGDDTISYCKPVGEASFDNVDCYVQFDQDSCQEFSGGNGCQWIDGTYGTRDDRSQVGSQVCAYDPQTDNYQWYDYISTTSQGYCEFLGGTSLVDFAYGDYSELSFAQACCGGEETYSCRSISGTSNECAGSYDNVVCSSQSDCSADWVSSFSEDISFRTNDRQYICNRDLLDSANKIVPVSEDADFAWWDAQTVPYQTHGLTRENGYQEFVSNGEEWFICGEDNFLEGTTLPVADSQDIDSCLGTLNKLYREEAFSSEPITEEGFSVCSGGNSEYCCISNEETNGDFFAACDQRCFVSDGDTLFDYRASDDGSNNFNDVYCTIFANDPFCTGEQEVESSTFITSDLPLMTLGYTYNTACTNVRTEGKRGVLCSEQYGTLCKSGEFVNVADADQIGATCCLVEDTGETPEETDHCTVLPESLDATQCEELNGNYLDRELTDNDYCSSSLQAGNCCLSGSWKIQFDYTLTSLQAQDADGFLCHQYGDEARVTECCYDITTCTNYKGNALFNGLERRNNGIVGVGGTSNTVEVFDSFSDSGILENAYLRKTDLSVNSPLIIDVSSDDLRVSTNWERYEYLLFDVMFNTPVLSEIVLHDSNDNSAIYDFDLVTSETPLVWQRASIQLQEPKFSSPLFDLSNVVSIEITVDPFFSGTADIIVDNIHLYNEDLDTTPNHYCSGPFGSWLDDVDGSIEADYDPNDFTQSAPYQFTCDAVGSYDWSGTQCCGDDSIQFHGLDGAKTEFYSDSWGGCYGGNFILDGAIVGEVISDEEYNHLLYAQESYHVCRTEFTQDKEAVYRKSDRILADGDLISQDHQAYDIVDDYVCEITGQWLNIGDVSKRKILAAKMFDIALESQRYEIFCDDINSVSPYNFLGNTNGELLVDQVEDFCVLNDYGTSDDEQRVLVGLNFEGVGLEEFLSTLGSHLVLQNRLSPEDVESFSQVCSSATSSSENDFFYACDSYDSFRLRYNPDYDIVLLSDTKNPITDFDGFMNTNQEEGSFLSNFWLQLLLNLETIFTPGDSTEYDNKLPSIFLEQSFDIDAIYLSQYGDLTIHSLVEGDTALVEYGNFVSDIQPLVYRYYDEESDNINYILGTNRQVVTIDADAAQENLFSFEQQYDWRRFSTALEKVAISGTPISGSAGSGTIDIGEDCDWVGDYEDGDFIYADNDGTCGAQDSFYVGTPTENSLVACTLDNKLDLDSCNICGDERIVGDEQCDNGPLNGNNRACTSECKDNVCGDNHRYIGIEQCDLGKEYDADGNQIDTDGCLNSCVFNYCGDGILDTSSDSTETCDDGNANNNDACNNQCQPTFCGDGVTQAVNGEGFNEVCDGDRNVACQNIEGYNGLQDCANDCSEFNSCTAYERCGDGLVNGPEQCDDGNSEDFDRCTNSCELTVCGDGFVQSPNGDGVVEVCDTNTVEVCTTDDGYEGTRVCNDVCTALAAECATDLFCGDGFTDGDERCDEGENNGVVCDAPYQGSCQYCSSTCQDVIVEGAFCGDGETDVGEQCDDGGENGIECDPFEQGTCEYCGTSCEIETVSGFCGDEFVEEALGEECDVGGEGTLRALQTCNPEYDGECTFCNALTCEYVTIEGGFCGDGIINGDEVCDGDQFCMVEGDEDTSDTFNEPCPFDDPNCDSDVDTSFAGTRSCSSDCSTLSDTCERNSYCGDGIVDAGEECDYAVSGSTNCNTSCQITSTGGGGGPIDTGELIN